MRSIKKGLHRAFSDFFSEKELKDVFKKACLRSYDGLVIVNEGYLFELSVCSDDDILIVCKSLDIESCAQILDKELFLKRLQAYPPVEVKTYDVS